MFVWSVTDFQHLAVLLIISNSLWKIYQANNLVCIKKICFLIQNKQTIIRLKKKWRNRRQLFWI